MRISRAAQVSTAAQTYAGSNGMDGPQAQVQRRQQVEHKLSFSGQQVLLRQASAQGRGASPVMQGGPAELSGSSNSSMGSSYNLASSSHYSEQRSISCGNSTTTSSGLLLVDGSGGRTSAQGLRPGGQAAARGHIPAPQQAGEMQAVQLQYPGAYTDASGQMYLLQGGMLLQQQEEAGQQQQQQQQQEQQQQMFYAVPYAGYSDTGQGISSSSGFMVQGSAGGLPASMPLSSMAMVGDGSLQQAHTRSTMYAPGSVASPAGSDSAPPAGMMLHNAADQQAYRNLWE
jgi:hypothetical protein